MKAAVAIQRAMTAQRDRDLARIALADRLREALRMVLATVQPPPVLVRHVPCPTCTFWRDRYDAALDEVEHLVGQLALHHIRPASRDLPDLDTEPAAATAG